MSIKKLRQSLLTNDEKYIQRCIDLALKAKGLTSPNPLVGSVIVKDNKILGEGYHTKAGEDHAELAAIKNANTDLSGATLYCNLEPCCHTNKRTAPCAQRIIKEGISKVIIANLDPNPNVAGSGVKLLQDNGIEVITGVLSTTGLEINRHFFHYIKSDIPYIHLKWAQTLDGKVASHTGDSKWITNEQARAHVHAERLFYDAIMVGANTLKNDNPKLTIREGDKVIKCPKRIVLAPSGIQTKDFNLFTDEYKDQTMLISEIAHDNLDSKQLMQCLRDENGRIDLNNLLVELKKRGVNSLYIEGGSKLISGFLELGLFHEISVYIASRILGNGLGLLEHREVNKMSETINLDLHKLHQFDDNLMLNYRKSF